MYGNVKEWTQDLFVNQPYLDITQKRKGVATILRVIRGGDWEEMARSCSSAFRDGRLPNVSKIPLGFRLALGQEP
jgi:formylglycine-generating enzyme required for sulfatase activity